MSSVPSSRRFYSESTLKTVAEDAGQKPVLLDVVSRMRDNKKFRESESAFSEFAVKNNFKGQYELYMQGCVEQIRE